MTPGPGLQASTSSVEATRSLAGALAATSLPGDLLVLSGDLGAGKTAFVQGYAAALGVTGRVTSPTFTIAHRYEGRVPVHHLDVYRLDRLGEVADLGLPELLDDGGVVLVEWGDVIAPALPAERLEVSLRFGAGDDERLLGLDPAGERWCARWPGVAGALAPWNVGASGPPC